MSAKKTIDKTILATAVLGSLVFINIISVGLFGRLDLTRDKQFTLSPGTTGMLHRLSDPVTVRAYFTEDLPPPYATNRRYVKDLLEEYYNKGDGNFRFEFIDPTAEETEADKEKKKDTKRDIFGRTVREATSIEKELQAAGIPPVQVRVNEDDKLEVKRAYMGISVVYGSNKEVIPVVQDTGSLEYDLTSLIRKVTRDKPPKVVLATALDMSEFREEMGRMHGALGQLYDVETVELDGDFNISEDAQVLLVVGPRNEVPEAAKRAIDAFVMSGRSVAFLLDNAVADTSTMQATEINHGLKEMLAHYGVQIDSGLALDAQCATISVQQQRGFMRIMQPVQYPFMISPKALDADHPLTRGISQVAFPFMAPLKLNLPEGSEVKGDILVKTSEQSWIQEPPYNLDPLQRWTPDTVSIKGHIPLVITLQGPVKSFYNDAGGEEGAQAAPAVANNARILVAGGSGLMMDQYASAAGNAALVLNLLDWMVLEEALLAVRARGLAAAPLDEVSDGHRQALKYLNILGLPMLFAAFGMVRWRRRETRRSSVQI